MKINSICILFLLISLTFPQLFSQTKNQVVITFGNANDIYLGIENTVKINAAGVSSNLLNVSANIGVLTGDKGQYIYKVEQGTQCTFTIEANINNKLVKIGDYTYKLKRIPDPLPCFAGKCGREISLSKAQMLNNPEITLQPNPTFIFKVVSFTLSYIVGKDLYEQTVNGNKLSQIMLQTINKCGYGQKVYIENIRVLTPDSTTRIIQPITIKVI